MITMQNNLPHQCHCLEVHKCDIFVHPDPGITNALNELVNQMTRYDEETGGSSGVTFHSDMLSGGQFHSVTQNTKPVLVTEPRLLVIKDKRL